MPTKPTFKFNYFLLLLLLFTSNIAAAQDQYKKIISRIDSLADAGLPNSALKEVDKLERMAKQDKNAALQVKAVIYRMNLQSYLAEDVMDTIITHLQKNIKSSAYPVKPVLQSLLAETYWKYYQQNRYLITQRTRLFKPDTDFNNWDLQTIINQTDSLYRTSLADAKTEQATPIGILGGVLDGDSATRYLRPTLYDLLVQRAFEFYLSDEPALIRAQLPFSLSDPLFFGSSRNFATLKVVTTDTTSTYFRGIKYLQQATAFHLQNGQDEALADINLQRLRFLYSKSNIAHKDSLYLAALKQIVLTFSDKPLSAEALVMQGQYYQRLDSLTIAYNYFKQARAFYPASLGGKNAATLISGLEKEGISATVEGTNMPGKPLLAMLEYTNIRSAKIMIYKLSQSQLTDYMDGFGIKITNTVVMRYRKEFLKHLEPVQNQLINCPDYADYRRHNLEFKIGALQRGNYIMLVKDALSDDETVTTLTDFKITGMAYSTRENPDGNIELSVMDREAGKPLHGVGIRLEGSYYIYGQTSNAVRWKDTVERGITDKNGVFISKKKLTGNNISIELTTQTDTLITSNNYVSGALNDLDDDDDEDKTVLFTDRQLYRPGQTIYFKALQLSVKNGKNKIVPDKDVKVEFSDINDKLISSLQLRTNEYGTVSGSFIIPQSILNGDVELATDDGNIRVRVEEYKRPTFEVEFLPVTGAYKPNDTVTVKGTAMAFSGYGLSQAKLNYHITRSPGITYQDEIFGAAIYGSRYSSYGQVTEIATGTAITDDQGKYQVKFKAIPGNENSDAIYNYSITADITDASGETRSAHTNIIIGDDDIRIINDLPGQLFAKDSLTTTIRLSNLNGRPQKGDVSVIVYALKSPEHLSKNRLWNVPDKFILSKEDFKKDFPDYTYRYEDMVSTWPVINEAFNLNLKIDTDKASLVNLEDLKKQDADVYRVIIRARNMKGDTASIVKYITLVRPGAKPDKLNDWVTMVANRVKAGQSAEFLVGIGKNINVLMERYNGPKLVSSKWISIKKNRQLITIPVIAKDKDAAVQFMMIYHNRIYTSYQKIYVISPDENLRIKLLTFRNKLQPGDKEQWKLQVTDPHGEKQTAEMLATLYDASLDDIAPAQNWMDALTPQEKYHPNYFAWDASNLVNTVSTNPVRYDGRNISLLSRSYETLNLMGYNYYGDYNTGFQRYLQRTRVSRESLNNDHLLEESYVKNAKLFKNGYDISGKVIDATDSTALPGVSIVVKGTSVSTTTNSQGRFKMRVPVNAKLIFSYIGYTTKVSATTKTAEFTVSLEANNSKLQEVVVGYGSQKRKSVTGSVESINIRGISSLEGKVAGVAIMDTGSPGTADKVAMREIRTLKPTVIRKNFNETAFFYPHLHTDAKGEILIDFTIPEVLTRWKFKALAQTADLHTGYLENTVITQKQLSISANMPRFLREGDTLTISARVVNLTGRPLKGTASIQLFNALNMQPVMLLQNPADEKQGFELAAESNKAVSFKLVIPAGLNALTYRLTAEGGEHSDGEENAIPVLPNHMLVAESMPMMIRAGQTRTFNFDKLTDNKSTTLKSKVLTLEYTQNPAWYAVQAMPYMMEYQYECSEQLFSRYYANSIATNLVNSMPVIKQAFDQWKNTNSTTLLSNLEKNQELKYTLLEETPWLRDATSETEQKNRIALLFDLNKMSNEMQLNLGKLQQRQLPNGGFPWFGGIWADRYITQHIVAGIGQLYHLHIVNDTNEILKKVSGKALAYLDNELLKDDKESKKAPNYESRSLNSTEVHAWYARSYYPEQQMSADLKKVFSNYLKRAEKQWVTDAIYDQGMIALTMWRNNKPVIAAAIMRSLMETAHQTDDMGMYWAKNQSGYYWYQSPVETQSLLIELFTEAGNNKKAVEEMKIWLMRTKQASNWKTTTATAAACYALLLKQDVWLTSTSSEIKLDGKPLSCLKPAVKAEAGTGYFKTSWTDEQIGAGLGKVEITNNGKSLSWGGMYWQYLEQLDKITPSQTDIHLERKYFIQKQTAGGQVLTVVDKDHQPQVGDLLKVVVYMKAGRDFEYVQLKDMRPGGTEPVDVLSAYKYQDGLYYYQITRDVATNFFISNLNKGNYVFEYQLRVTQPGNFSTGITTVQCMYAPEFASHSEGIRVTFK